MNPMHYIKKDYLRKPVYYDYSTNDALRRFARIRVLVLAINLTVSLAALILVIWR
ncbi:MAG: hypothetical protein M1151_02045 [Candidatus Thermoplasmatota archaeon]|jgi:hypothetical protein|nr:hypothetical protein [Candidatus Thermoplasmatota archaeon]MCL5785436.1 hypothetical protein [Candidatus Thermoplasmatota archaeon]